MSKLNNNDVFQLIYGVQNNIDRPGWTTLHEFDNISTNKNFTAKVYKRNNTVVISFAGSQTPDDYKNSLYIINRNEIPAQYWDAKYLYNTVKRKYPNSSIEFTGYSLGASLANLLSLHTGNPSSVIAPIGSKHIAEANKREFQFGDSQIKSFGRLTDYFFKETLANQSGELYIVPDLEVNLFKNNQIYGKLNRTINNAIRRPHLLGNYAARSLNAAKPYNRGQKTGFAAPLDNISEIFTPEEIGRMSADEFFQNEKAIMQQLRNGKIGRKIQNYAGYKNPLTGNGKIFSREDISAMSGEEYLRHENAIMSQLKEIGIPSSSELETSSLYTGGTVYVRPYVRDDGTKVRGYWRSLPD